jgi:hypothetical protein
MKDGVGTSQYTVERVVAQVEAMEMEDRLTPRLVQVSFLDPLWVIGDEGI